MADSRNLHHYDYPGTIEAAYYLLEHYELTDLHINLEKENVAAYLMHMSDQKTWQQFKADIEMDFDNREEESSTSVALQKNNAKKIDQLIQNGNLQTLLLSEKIVRQDYPNYFDLLKEYLTAEKDLEETRKEAMEKASDKIDEISDLEKLVANLADQLKQECEKDLKLKQLVNTIEWLRQKESLAYLHLESIKPAQIEGGAETFASADDLVIQALDYTKQFDVVDHSRTLSGIPTADTWIDAVRTIPVVNDFIRGLVYLWEAIEALDNKETPQRTAKMAAGFAGGLISIGTCIVGILLLGSVGLLATAAAAYVAPIAIAAATVGVYGITLVRDIYVLSEGYQQLQRSEAKLREINFAMENSKTSALDFAHLSLQKANLLYATTELRHACEVARKKVILSTICVAALSLTLAAVCLTGVGALVLGAIGGSVLLGTTIARIYLSRKEKQKRLAEHAKQAKPAQGEESVNFSVSEVELANTEKKPTSTNHGVLSIEESLLGSREGAENALKEMLSHSQSNLLSNSESTPSQQEEGASNPLKMGNQSIEDTDNEDDSKGHSLRSPSG